MSSKVDNSGYVNSSLGASIAAEAFARAVADVPNLGTCFAPPGLSTNSAAAVTADRVYYAQVIIPTSATLTGIIYNCASGATGNSRVALYDASGTRVANRSTNFTVAALDYVAFDTTYAATKGVYFLAVVFSGTPTCTLQTPALPSGFTAGPGSGATATSITPPTTISSTRVAALATY